MAGLTDNAPAGQACGLTDFRENFPYFPKISFLNIEELLNFRPIT
jgi:hypothetical protein